MLEELFSGQHIYQDTDGDGLIDRVSASLVLARNLCWSAVWAEAAHLACRWAFETVRLDAPLVRLRKPSKGQAFLEVRLQGRQDKDGKRPVATVRLFRKAPLHVLAVASSPAATASFLRLLALSDVLDLPRLPEDWSVLEWIPAPPALLKVWNRGGGTQPFFSHRIASAKAVLLDLCCPFEMRPQATAPKDAPDLLHLSAAHGFLETSPEDPRHRSFRLAVVLPSQRLSPRVGRSLCHALSRISLHATQIQIPFIFVGPMRHDGVVLEIREDPGCPSACIETTGENGRHIILQGSETALEKALLGWLLWAVREPGPGAEPIVALRDQVQRVTYRKTCSASTGEMTAFPPVLKECRWNAEHIRLEKLLTKVPAGQGPLSGILFVSKPAAVRRRLKGRLEKILRAKGYEPQLEVYNAYKPGLCWLLEKVLPAAAMALKENTSPVEGVELSFSPFVGTPEAMETRTRWLQEIYPGPDLLAKNLGLDVSQVHVRLDSEQQSVYRIRIWNRRGDLLLDEALTPRWTALPYFGRISTSAKVHPTTAGVLLLHRSRVLLDHSIPTDREVFWKVFGRRWLPALFRAMKRRLPLGERPQLRAFWEEIRITAAIEETECPLGLDQERLSPMEALHEDIYFTLLEAFKDFAEHHGLPRSVQLGQVMPFVTWKKRARNPHARLVAGPLTESWTDEPVQNPESSRGDDKADDNQPRIRWLRCHPKHWDVGLSFSPSTNVHPAQNLPGKLLSPDRDRGAPPDEELVLRFPAPRRQRSSRKNLERELSEPPPTDRILRLPEVTRWAHRLAQAPALQVWQASRTFHARPVWSLEATLPYPSESVSQARLRLLKPTILFNARHHANEVSSTEAALFFAWTVAATEEGQALLRKVNLVWIPAENADGIAAFERLYPTAPGHKLHAARYNALGCEFYEDYFAKRPRFPEALAKRRVWERWLPQMVLDGHGVPSHEWDQPFSGYLPGNFAEHWIPRAFLYVYLPYLDEPTHPRHHLALEIARRIERHVRNDPELVRRNEDIRRRYQRYAESWNPEIFPPVGHGPVAVLPPVARVAQLNYSAQRPDITCLEVVTEVADEVAEGPWLDLCVRGHLAVFTALLEFLQSNAQEVIKTAEISGRTVRFCWRYPSTNPK